MWHKRLRSEILPYSRLRGHYIDCVLGCIDRIHQYSFSIPGKKTCEGRLLGILQHFLFTMLSVYVSTLRGIEWENDELEWIWKKEIVAWETYCLGISFQGLRKTTNILNRDSRWPARYSNLSPPEYKSRLLILKHPAPYLWSNWDQGITGA
jgi:hypothetical protein